MVLTLDSCDHRGLLASLCCPTFGARGEYRRRSPRARAPPSCLGAKNQTVCGF